MKGVDGMRNVWIRSGTGLVALLLVGALQVPSSALDRGARSSGHSALAATGSRVKIIDFAFRPGTLTIAKGTRVKWTNRGAVTHTSTSNKGVWDSGSIAPGGTFSRVFKRAGTFKYHCTIHPTMTAKIVVS
jgi:plastocyanin